MRAMSTRSRKRPSKSAKKITLYKASASEIAASLKVSPVEARRAQRALEYAMRTIRQRQVRVKHRASLTKGHTTSE